MILKACALGFVLVVTSAVFADAPYPPSPVIADISLDWSTHQRQAVGSDNWQLTWADDDHQYGAWGDGGGFGGSNSDGRVGLGFARIEGDWDDYEGFNVWGGKNPENPAQFDGKSWGTICVDGVLYSWVIPDVPDTGGGKNNDSLNTVRGTFQLLNPLRSHGLGILPMKDTGQAPVPAHLPGATTGGCSYSVATSLKLARAASIVRSMSCFVCASETNIAS